MDITRLEELRKQPSTVNCNGCTSCCKSDRVFLGPKDDPKAYRWHVEDGYAVLDRKDNGDCTYITESGCGIHGSAPDICKRMDCRVLFMLTPTALRAIRQEENPQMTSVYQAGLTRLHTLDS